MRLRLSKREISLLSATDGHGGKKLHVSNYYHDSWKKSGTCVLYPRRSVAANVGNNGANTVEMGAANDNLQLGDGGDGTNDGNVAFTMNEGGATTVPIMVEVNVGNNGANTVEMGAANNNLQLGGGGVGTNDGNVASTMKEGGATTVPIMVEVNVGNNGANMVEMGAANDNLQLGGGGVGTNDGNVANIMNEGEGMAYVQLFVRRQSR